MIGSLLVWLIVLPLVERFPERTHPFSRTFFIIRFGMLPIFVVEGYLAGGWRWKDLEKKEREEGLPPA